MKKKIMFLIESLAVGGAERVLIDLVNNLDPDSFDITVVTVYKESVYPYSKKKFETTFQPHINYRWLCNNNRSFIYRVFNYGLAHFPRLMYRLFMKNGFDTEIAFYEGLPTSWMAFSPYKCKKIAWLHTSAEYSQAGKDKEILKQTYLEFDKIMAVSEKVKDSFVDSIGFEEKTIVLYNPIDELTIREKALLSSSRTKEKIPVFVSVGRLNPVKGYDRLLHIISRLKQEGYRCRLWLVGDGVQRHQLEGLIRDLSIEEEVTLWGNQDNPYPFVSTADWFVCSSYIEGYSTAVAESLIIGTPVISVMCPGMEELLGKNGEYGLLTNNSEEELYNALKSAMIDSSLLDYYKKKAIERGALFEMSNQIESISYELY